MKFVFLVMDESNIVEGKFFPSKQDYTRLKAMADNPDEREYIKRVENAKFGFAYNMIYFMQQSCGHYEVFQTHVSTEVEAISWMKQMSYTAARRKCTRCQCLLELKGI